MCRTLRNPFSGLHIMQERRLVDDPIKENLCLFWRISQRLLVVLREDNGIVLEWIIT